MLGRFGKPARTLLGCLELRRTLAAHPGKYATGGLEPAQEHPSNMRYIVAVKREAKNRTNGKVSDILNRVKGLTHISAVKVMVFPE